MSSFAGSPNYLVTHSLIHSLIYSFTHIPSHSLLCKQNYRSLTNFTHASLLNCTQLPVIKTCPYQWWIFVYDSLRVIIVKWTNASQNCRCRWSGLTTPADWIPRYITWTRITQDRLYKTAYTLNHWVTLQCVVRRSTKKTGSASHWYR